MNASDQEDVIHIMACGKIRAATVTSAREREFDPGVEWAQSVMENNELIPDTILKAGTNSTSLELWFQLESWNI